MSTKLSRAAAAAAFFAFRFLPQLSSPPLLAFWCPDVSSRERVLTSLYLNR